MRHLMKRYFDPEQDYGHITAPVPLDKVILAEEYNTGWKFIGLTFNPRSGLFTFYFEKVMILPSFNPALNSPFETFVSDVPPDGQSLVDFRANGFRYIATCYHPPLSVKFSKEAAIKRPAAWVTYAEVVSAQGVETGETLIERPVSEAQLVV